jgi:hypothetical protein
MSRSSTPAKTLGTGSSPIQTALPQLVAGIGHVSVFERVGIRRGKDWIFVSADLRLLKNKPERAALRAAGLYGFILAAGYQKMPDNQVASNLIWKWPEIENAFNAVGPSIFELPVSRSAKPKPLSF